MEYVMTKQETMAGELKELMLKGLLTEGEVKQIVARRTAFESALIRLEPRKSDYLRYIEYLMALEALRRKRMKRLDLTSQGSSKADYCLVEAQFNVFERAVRKFKDDIGLWVQFIEHARRERAVVLTGKLTARALQLHPNSTPLYILAAKHQLDASAPGSARTMFQRGLRLNGESVELWTEYVKMELAYVETLRRELKRTRVMRKQLVRKARKQDPGGELPGELQGGVKEDESLKEVLDGAVVREVIRGAVEALPTVALFTSLRRLLFHHPTPLRAKLLDELHAWLVKLLPRDPHAVKLAAVWWIDDNWVEGADVVDALHAANTKLQGAVRSADADGFDSKEMGRLYAGWVAGCVRRVNSVPLKEYFTRSLHTLITTLPLSQLSATLLSTDLQLAALRQAQNDTKTKILARARKYISLFPSSAEIWIPYLALAKDARIAEWRALWDEAREKARGSVEELCRVWLWGLPMVEDEEKEAVYHHLLKSSIQHPCKTLHPHLLLQFIEHIYLTTPTLPSKRWTKLQHALAHNLPSPACYRFAFSAETHHSEPSRAILSLLYDRWRVIDGEEIEAALRYGAWLLLHAGDGRAAKEVVERTRAVLDDEGRRVLDENWVAVMDAPEEGEEEMDVVRVPPELEEEEDDEGESEDDDEEEDEEEKEPEDTSGFISLNMEW